MKIVCAADCGVDRYGDRGLERAGGIGLNVAVHARRLLRARRHRHARRAGRRRRRGRARARRRRRAPASTACLEVVPGATPVQHIRQAPDGERVFERFDEGVLGRLPRERAPARRDRRAATCSRRPRSGRGSTFFESVMACRPPGLRAVDFTNANDVGDPVAFAARWAPELDVGLFGLQPSDGALIDELERGRARQPPALRRHARRRTARSRSAACQRIACPAQPTSARWSTRPARATRSRPASCASTRADATSSAASRAGTEVAASTLGHSARSSCP